MAIADASPSSSKSTNMVQDTKWPFSVHRSYNPSIHDACIVYCVDSHVWFFDNGGKNTLLCSVTCSLILSLLLQGILPHAQKTPCIQ